MATPSSLPKQLTVCFPLLRSSVFFPLCMYKFCVCVCVADWFVMCGGDFENKGHVRVGHFSLFVDYDEDLLK